MEKGQFPLLSDYRLNKFVIYVEINNGWILYNATTGGIVSIDNEDDIVMSLDKLKEMYFLVPHEFDEVSWVNRLRETKGHISKKKGIDGFTILTTTDCNARCFYCYEKGQAKITMTEQIANDVADFIIKSSTGTRVNIRWFGGEPLLNTNSIDIICNTLKANGIIYDSKMISNGLLFSDSMVKKAKKIWKLKSVQITLDGKKCIYQKAKAYKNATGDEFDRVIANINKLADANIKVSIRLNQDFYNTTDLQELVEFLSNEFKGKKQISVYNNWLYDNNDALDIKQDKEKYAKFKELQDKLLECGLYSNNPLNKKLRVYHCMADSDSSVIITPNGDIGKCEHYTDKHIIGNIYKNQFDENERLKCKEKHQLLSKCFECPLYPQCVRIKLCPVEGEGCSSIQCENKIELVQRALMNKYQSMKRGE